MAWAAMHAGDQVLLPRFAVPNPGHPTGLERIALGLAAAALEDQRPGLDQGSGNRLLHRAVGGWKTPRS